jgi:predicted amidophosphoribosyltransferase
MANCTQCGSQLKVNKSFCTVCGAKVKVAAAQSLPRTPLSVPLPCPKCGATVPAGKRFCTRCGDSRRPSAESRASLAAKRASVAEVNCASCGASLPAGKRFCTACGNPVETKPADPFLPLQNPPNPPVIEAAPVRAKPVEVKPPDTRMTPDRRRLWRIALPITAFVVAAGAWFAIYPLFTRQPAQLHDKQLLESHYGPPPFFTVILATDEGQPSLKLVRREVWVYPERKVSFVFLGGKYQFSSDLQLPGKGATKAASKLRLEQITESLTIEEFSKLVGSQPVSQATLPKEELPDAIRYEYGNGISAVFCQGRLLMVRLMPAQGGDHS